MTEGQSVKTGDLLCEMDVKYVEDKGLSSEILMVYQINDNKLELKPLENANLNTTVAIID